MGEHRNIGDGDLKISPARLTQEEDAGVFGGGFSYGRGKRVDVGDAGTEMLRGGHRNDRAFRDQKKGRS